MELDTKLQCKKQVLLSNPTNKHDFIRVLSRALEATGYCITDIDRDADLKIVQGEADTVLVGDETDLLVLFLVSLYHFTKNKATNKIFIMRPSSKHYIDIKTVI